MHHPRVSVPSGTVWPRLFVVGLAASLTLILLISFPRSLHAAPLPPRLWLPLTTANWRVDPPLLVGPVAWRWSSGIMLGSPRHMVMDWDGDGQDEVVAEYYQNVFVLRHTDGYDFAQVFSAPAEAGWGLGDLNGDGRRELWTVTMNGQVNCYTPGEFAPTSLKRLAMPANAIQIISAVGADLLGDGKPVLIAAFGLTDKADVLAAYRLPDLQLLWQRPFGGTTPVLSTAQLDGDPQLEIISQANSQILDGATGALQWQYGATFWSAATADIDGDHLDELVIHTQINMVNLAVALDVDTRTEKWRRSVAGTGETYVGVGDVTGDSVPELLVSRQVQSVPRIDVVDIATAQVLWSISAETGWPIYWIDVGDVDMDGRQDIVWADSRLHITPADETVTRFSVPSSGPSYRAIAMQMDADPGQELVVLSSGDTYGRPFYQIFDGLTGLPKRQLQLNFDVLSFPGMSEPLTASLDGDPWPELVVGVGHDIYKFDHDGKRLAKAIANDKMVPVWAGDVDGDGSQEVVTYGDQQIAIHRADNLLYEWQGSTPNMVEAVAADVDRDGHVEIIFHDFYMGPSGTYVGNLQAYDGATHQLRWRMPATPHFWGLTVGDVNGDGVIEILTGENDALHVYNGATRQLLYVGPRTGVSQLALLPLRGASIPQLAVVTGREVLLFTAPLDPAPTQILPGGSGDHVTTIDRRADGHNDLLISGYSNIQLFPASSSYCDGAPIVVMSTQPSQGQDLVSRDAEISAVLTDAPASATLVAENVRLLAGGAVIPAAVSYSPSSHTLRLAPTGLLPADAQMTVWLGPNLRDICGNGVLANGATPNTYQWTFRTGSGTDTFGPVATNMVIAPSAPWAGMALTLTARLDDANPAGASGVTRAEYALDAPATPGAGISMTAADGAFGGRIEQATAHITTDGWITPTRTLYVRGQDSRGNWGAATAINVTLQQIAAGSWPTYGQNAARAGYQATVTDTTGYDLAWVAASNATGQSVAVNDTIITIQHGQLSYGLIGRVLATNLSTGRELWHRDFVEIIGISPATIAYGRVYFQVTGYSSETKNLYAVDLRDGREVWHAPFDAQDNRFYAPAVASGRVFAPCGRYNGLCAWDAYTGQALWNQEVAGQYDRWTPSYADGVVYVLMPTSVGAMTLYLQAFDPGTSRPLWTANLGAWDFPYGYSLYHNTAVSNGKAFVTGSGALIAIDLASHSVKWRVWNGFVGTPAAADGQVFAVGGSALRVYDDSTGAFQWSYVANQTLNNQPLVTPSHVFVSSDRHTWRINRSTHQVDWETDRGGWLTLAGGQLLITEESGQLVAYRPR
jgi:hypothetical protein